MKQTVFQISNAKHHIESKQYALDPSYEFDPEVGLCMVSLL
jgi:hypothetical protein